MESKRSCLLWLGLTFCGKGRDRALLSLSAVVMHPMHAQMHQYRQRSTSSISWALRVTMVLSHQGTKVLFFV